MQGDISLRIASPADAPALAEIYAPYVEQTAVSFEYDAPTPDEFARRIERTLEKYPYLVAERAGVPVGYAYAGAFHSRAAYGWAVETSIYVRARRAAQRRRPGAVYGAGAGTAQAGHIKPERMRGLARKLRTST